MTTNFVNVRAARTFKNTSEYNDMPLYKQMEIDKEASKYLPEDFEREMLVLIALKNKAFGSSKEEIRSHFPKWDDKKYNAFKECVVNFIEEAMNSVRTENLETLREVCLLTYNFFKFTFVDFEGTIEEVSAYIEFATAIKAVTKNIELGW